MPAIRWIRPFATSGLTVANRIGPWPTVTVAAAFTLIWIGCGCGRNAAGTGSAGVVGQSENALLDIDGASHWPFGDHEVRAVVLVFVVPDCPISNSYVPELNRLYSDYMPRGVRLFLVQVDPQLSVDDAREHARTYQLQPPVILDQRHVWVRKVGATITPEAAVLSPAGDVLYVGRIDDRYADLGRRRDHVASHDLRDALDAILGGLPAPRSQSKGFGCSITDLQ